MALRILHLSSSDSGGAGRACVRLHLALLDSGIDSILLTQNKTTDTPKVIRLAQTKFQKLIEKLRPSFATLPLMLYPKRHKDIFSPNFFVFPPRNAPLLKAIQNLKPDIIHLHWIESGFINTKDLLSIAKLGVPMLWSLHDANPYTGGCHYVAAACIGVGTHCKHCPLLRSTFAFDISFWTFRHKRRTYAHLSNLTINGLSRWIMQSSQQSALLGDKPHINLPNPINTDIYAPLPKNIARTILKITKSSHIIGFGAIGATSVPRKGYNELKTALLALSQTYNLKLLVFGASEGESITGVETHFLGFLHDELSLRLVYNACDVVVVPSHLESFGQTASESLSCGTPVVCFDTSGLQDIIAHKHNGYRAKAFDTNDLQRGIEWVLNLNAQEYATLSHNARTSVVQKFSSHKVAQKYIHAYQRLLGGGQHNAR